MKNPTPNDPHTGVNQTYASIAQKGNVPLTSKVGSIRRLEKNHKFKHVSAIGWITGKESKQAKILSMGSSEFKLGFIL
ncbi:hypothetical protein AYI69_g10423 [Smittium culicis]|uniref:Uncharacterized protein n=1 Tax=Smittium culicis TaxID=133412 RepID=A0A1R1X5S7_9FUNG|nr:hypothetical protein AYI69_g10423 [Smittium culicis]